MYTEYFGLKEFPFSIAPDPRYLYMSHKHREALAHLVYGINSDGGFVLLTGEVGTGKTTICRCLLEQLPDNTDIAFVLNPKLSVEELLATFCDELGIRYPRGNRSVKIFVDFINTYLLDAHARGRKTVLIIEEAQNLTTDVLEQLRLLTNLETNERKLLQIIMVGQPELQDKLAKPEMRQLAQRITARYHLDALSRKEVAEYVHHRLAVGGVHGRLFPPSVLDKLFRLSRGIPRLINVICDRALLGAYVQGKELVDKPTLTRAAKEVFGEQQFRERPRVRWQWALAGLVLSVSAVVLAATVYNHKMPLLSSHPRVAMQPAVAAPQPPKLDTLQWADGQPMALSREMAYQALFQQWNIPYSPEKKSTSCQQAKSRGLECMYGRSDLNHLLQLNRPAVMKLLDAEGREYYAALTALDGTTATFMVGSDTRKVDIGEIEPRWSGDYTLFWRMPPNFRGRISQGAKGATVRWLENHLAVINSREARSQKNLILDDTLVTEVKKFQLSKGLTPDGAVGPETIIQLNTAVGSDEPLLYPKREEH